MRIDGSYSKLHGAYQTNRSLLQKSLKRLSSGDNMDDPGRRLGGDLSVSERLRFNIHAANASTNSIQQAQAFLNTADNHIESVTHLLDRMMELTARASDGLSLTSDRYLLNAEFQSLKSEISQLTRNAKFAGKQTISKEVMLSFDAQTQKMRFWQPTGLGESEIQRDFSANAVDILNQPIGFNSSENFSMSGDGKSLYFLGDVAGDPLGTVRFKKYDIDNKTVSTSATTVASGSKLTVDESGKVFISNGNTIYQADPGQMTLTATGVTDNVTQGRVAVYQNSYTYQRTSDLAIVNVTNLGITTVLTSPVASLSAIDHDFSASGSYLAKNLGSQIEVLDTRSGQSATINIGSLTSVNNIQFDADGDRIYYINDDTKAIEYLSVSTLLDGSVELMARGAIVKADGPNCFSNLSIGGSNYSATTKYLLAEDAVSTLSYEAADITLYQIGLANAHIDTMDDATNALDSVKNALIKVCAERAKIGAMAARFEHVFDTHLHYIQSAKEAESYIREVDVAKETSEFSMLQMRDAAATAMLAQYNLISKNVLQLLHI